MALDSVSIAFHVVDERSVLVESCVKVTARTGVEMEALTAVSVAALTVYDMCKAIDREIVLGPFELLEKSGGKSGHFVKSTESPASERHPPG